MIASHKRAFLAHPVQIYFQRPVFLGLERTDLIFTIYHQTGSHRLNTACRQTTANLFPQQRRQLVTHDPVQYTASLLGIHQTVVDGSGIGDGLLYHLLGDLIKCHTICLVLRQLQKLLQMPGDSFALTVRVSCQVYGICRLCRLAQVGNDLRLAFHRDILRLKAVVNIHAHGALGQIPQVAHAGLNGILRSQIFSNGLRLGRRLHNYEIGSCHVFLQ